MNTTSCLANIFVFLLFCEGKQVKFSREKRKFFHFRNSLLKLDVSDFQTIPICRKQFFFIGILVKYFIFLMSEMMKQTW